jgi:hypothetical protein
MNLSINIWIITPIMSNDISKEGRINKKKVAIRNITISSHRLKTPQALVFTILSAFNVLYLTIKEGMKTISGRTLPRIKKSNGRGAIRPWNNMKTVIDKIQAIMKCLKIPAIKNISFVGYF